MLPPPVVTTTLAGPVPKGVVQVIDVVDVTVVEVQSFVAILTLVPPMTNWVPVMVTLVPPAVEPLLGLMAVTVGAAT